MSDDRDWLLLEDKIAAPGEGPAGLAWDGKRLWCADFRDGRLYRLVIPGGDADDMLICPGVPSGLAYDGDALWQGLIDEGWLRCINPVTHDFDRTIVVEEAQRLSGVAWDGKDLWVVAQQQGSLLRLDRDGGAVQQKIAIPVGAAGLTFARGNLWLCAPQAMRYDQDREIFIWEGPEVYTLLCIDALTGEVLDSWALDFLALGLAWVDDTLWLSDARHGALHRARVPAP